MKAVVFVALIVLEFSFSQHSVCFTHPPPLNLHEAHIKVQSAFTFKVHNLQAPIKITHRREGVFFQGNFSKIVLSGSGKHREYISREFTFKYPPQHRIAEVSQGAAEMQVQYELKEEDQSKWKHRRLFLSVIFVVTDYVAGEGFTLSKQINPSLINGTILDFGKLLPLMAELKMILYKGIHSNYAEDNTTLWAIRKEMLLMSQSELQYIQHLTTNTEEHEPSFHGLLKPVSNFNEIAQTQSETTHQPNNPAPPQF